MVEQESKYMSSKEVKKYLKIRDCDLAHKRLAGILKFIKKGNSYLYIRDSVEILKNRSQDSNNLIM